MRLPEEIAARLSWLCSGHFADCVKTHECLALTEAVKKTISQTAVGFSGFRRTFLFDDVSRTTDGFCPHLMTF